MIVRTSTQRVLKRAACVRDRVAPPARGVVVLAYHRIGERSDAREIDLPTQQFRAQMERVAASGVQTLDDALTALTAQELPRSDRVVVTFDDGTADFADLALPILVELRIPSVLYVATDFIERGLEFPGRGRPLSWAGLRDAIATGLVTVASHTHSHALLDRTDAAVAAAELDRSIDLLGARLGIAPAHFAYPKALAGNPGSETEVRKRFRSAAVAGTRANAYGATDPYRLLRSPVQRSDRDEYFARKLNGGLRLEDDVRRLANRLRYLRAAS